MNPKSMKKRSMTIEPPKRRFNSEATGWSNHSETPLNSTPSMAVRAFQDFCFSSSRKSVSSVARPKNASITSGRMYGKSCWVLARAAGQFATIYFPPLPESDLAGRILAAGFVPPAGEINGGGAGGRDGAAGGAVDAG